MSESSIPAPGKVSTTHRVIAALRVEHLLLVIFLAWYIPAFSGWYWRLGDALFRTNAVGISWVSGPAIVLMLIITVQHLAAWAADDQGEAASTAIKRLLGRQLQVAADWLPFFLFLSIYLMFHSKLMIAAQGAPQDTRLVRWEESLLGGHLSIWMERFVSVPLTTAMQACYMLHIFFTTPAAAVICYLKDRNLFRSLMLGLTVVAGIGAAGYAALPAVGPGIYLHARYSVDLPVTFLGRVIAYTDEVARSPQDIFPSLHVAISLLCLLALWRASRRWFWLLLPFVIGNWMSTIYLRYHYVIDCIAGALLAIFSFYLSLGLVCAEALFKARLGVYGGAAPNDAADAQQSA